jgi:protein TonB
LSTIFYRSETGQERSPLRRRAGSLALAVAIEVALLLAFLTIDLRPPLKPQFKGGTIATFDVSNEKESESAPAKAVKPVQAIREIKHPVLPQLKPPPITQPRTEIIPLSKEDLAASDISKLGSNAQGAGKMAEGSAPGDSERVGTGPHGEPLYAAEWYREPTDTEVNAYLPKTMPEGGGWGLIACRTIERFHVTDCVELGQSPPGSHLAGAARQAAWQFLVRPPRVGGKPLVGEWVRIRIDWTVGKGGGSAN